MNEKERLKEIIHILRVNNLLSGITPDKFCNVIEQLGPTFIKIGQIMSSRVDIFPEDYCNALARLRSNVTPMNFSVVSEILNEEYGDYKEIFSEIDTKCIGSASIAQVHKAKLVSGESVVIKVQRKDICNKMAMDVKLLKKAISLLRLNHIFKVMDLNDVLDQMYSVAKEEMNFEIEASHIEEFNNNNKDIVYVRAPKVYNNLVTTKVLVMENIDGITINNVLKLNEYGYDLNEIGLKVSDNYIKQAIDDGFFHADPHPDNIMILDGQIVFIDLGMMGRLSLRDRNLLKNCINAIVKNDVYEIEKSLLGLSDTYGDVNHVKLRRDIENILSRVGTTEIKDIDTAVFINNFFNMLHSNNIKLNKDITMLIRGISVIEGMLEEVSPTISLLQVFTNKVKDNYLDDLLTKDKVIKIGQNIVNSGDSAFKLPNETLKLISSINRGEINFKLELNDSFKKIDKLLKMLHQVIIGMYAAVLLLASCFVSSIVLRNIFLGLAIVFSAWLFIKMFLDHIDKG